MLTIRIFSGTATLSPPPSHWLKPLALTSPFGSAFSDAPLWLNTDHPFIIPRLLYCVKLSRARACPTPGPRGPRGDQESPRVNPHHQKVLQQQGELPETPILVVALRRSRIR